MKQPFRIALAVGLMALALISNAAAASDGSARTAPSSAATWRVGEVRFKGFESVTPDQARAVIETKEPGPLGLGVKLDPQQVRRDVRRLKQLFKENGLFDAKVTSRIERPAGGRAVVIFEADEGKLYYVDQVELKLPPGPTHDKWRKRLEAVSTIKLGARFNLTSYNTTKAEIRRIMGEEAHPLAKVAGQVRVYRELGRVVIVLEVDPGPKAAFGPTEVVGNQEIRTELVLRELTYGQGQPFAYSQLKETQKNLLNTGYFATVSPEPQLNRFKDGQVPIRLEVRERTPHSIRLGLGYGNLDQYRVKVTQINRNTLGLGEVISVEGKVSAIYQGMVARMVWPRPLGKGTTFILAGGVDQTDQEAYENRRFFVSPVLRYSPLPHWSVDLGYVAENNDLLLIKTQVEDRPYEDQNFMVSALRGGLQYDSRDHPLNPTEGTYCRAEVELATNWLGSELDYFQPKVDLRHVLPLEPLLGMEKWYLAGRVKLGMVFALPGTGRIPLIKRLYPGGPDSVRGYPYQRLGPLDQGGKPFGGEVSLESSLEVRFPIWKDLGGVVFVDAGNAWADVTTDLETIRFTAGAGLRYETPVGPLRVDFGYQLNPDPDAPIPHYDYYFSVGQAF